MVVKMDIKAKLNELHADLAELYRGKSTDQTQINHIWAQIDRLEFELVVGEA